MRKNRADNTIEHFRLLEKKEKFSKVIIDKKINKSFNKAYKNLNLVDLLKKS